MEFSITRRQVLCDVLFFYVGDSAATVRKTNAYRKQNTPSKNRWGVFIGKLEFDREFIQNHCNIVNYLFTLQFKISSIFFFKKLIADANVSIASPLCLSTGCETSYSIKSFLTLFLSCSTPMLQS